MTLQFDPGAYGQIFENAQNRKLQGQKMAADSLAQIPQALIGYSEQKKQDQMSRLMLALKAGEQGYDPNKFMNMGQDQGPSLMQRFLGQGGQGPAQNANGPDMPGMNQMASAGVSDYAEPQTPSLIDRAKAHFGGGSPASAQPGDPTSLFTRPNVDYAGVMGAAKNGDYGPMFKLPPKEQGLAMKGFEYEQNRADRESRDKQLTAYQQAQIDSQKQGRDFTMGEKENQFYQKEWDRIDKESNPLTASGRTGLGMAARADYNANRALVTLSKPMVTNQEAANVMADIAQIYQGGSPTEYGMSHQGYNTLYGNIMGAIQKLTGKPQDALTPEIQQRLIGVLNEMKQTNKAVFKQQLDHIERTQPKVIQRYQNEWKNLRANVEGGVAGGPASNPASSTGLTWQGRQLKDTPANRAWLQQQQGAGQ